MTIAIYSSETLTLELSCAVSADQPEFLATWIDEADDDVGSNKSELSDTTPVTAVSAPSSGHRILKSLFVCNLDSASVTVIAKVTGDTTRTILRRSLAAGESADLLQSATSGGVSTHSLFDSSVHTDVDGTPASGDIIYRNGSSKWANLTKGTDGQVLTLAGGLPSWAAGGSGGGDLLSTLVNTEVTVDAAATLTVGKMHLITDSGTPANYTVTLPAVSGNAGKFVGMRVSASATKHFTVDANGSEKIWTSRGEVESRIYVATESAIFQCDGKRWHVICETMRALAFHAHQTNAQSISASTATKVTLDTERFDLGGCFDSTTNNRFTPTAPGLYSFGSAVSIASISADKNVWCGIRINGSTTYWSQAQSISVNGMNPSAAGSLLFSLNGTSDYADLVVYHSDTGVKKTMVDAGQRCWLFGHRVCRETS